jgi:hypothetical protein
LKIIIITTINAILIEVKDDSDQVYGADNVTAMTTFELNHTKYRTQEIVLRCGIRALRNHS